MALKRSADGVAAVPPALKRRVFLFGRAGCLPGR